ncbi:MAG: S-layer homology domain-containing protein [Armatimonadota bacterium]|nr:S-layer homology domain-containing protein [Armatimonadota bacterium]
MKKTLCAIVMLALLASPVFAQGPFTDVPTDHWAYQAVDQLVKDGIIVGYPDGTFGGKRAMTRFEFAQALARAIPVIVDQAIKPVPPTPPAGVSQAEVDAVKARVATLEAAKPEVTKADLAAIQKMVDEFKDELTAMGVDIDALKRDVADLNKRLTALEEEVRRVKIGGTVNVSGVFERERDGSAVDRDERDLHGDDDLLQDITMVKEIDITIDARISDKATAHALLSAGDYLNYLNGVDDYDGGERATTQSDLPDPTDAEGQIVFPYYAYLDWNLGPGALTVGRFPMMWSPYTVKKIDVDSYTVNQKTDTGDYPLDGIKGAWKFGGVGLQLVAAKTDMNAFLVNGLTSQSDAGLYDTGVFNDNGGAAFGGLGSINQIAGGRITIGTPLKGTLSGTYLRGSEDGVVEQAQLVGADLNFQLGNITIGGEWAETTLTDTTVLDDDNTALDANLGIGLGSLGLKAGWKSIGHNFTAPGSWDKLGRWTNPTNIEGPYVDLKYGLGANISLVAAAEFLSGKDDVVGLPSEIDEEDDDVKYYTAGLKWGMSSSTSIDLGLEWVKWEPSGLTDTDEKYITIGLGHQFNPNMMAKIGYQIVDFDTGSDGHSYDSSDYKGDVAVAQFMVKF